jgi:Tol biopolymer transport system component/DNA-binding winged helix-turn-helix (wHTH) protein
MNRSIRIGDWVLTPASHRLTCGDTTHVLRAKLVQILVCLSEEPGRVLTREELMERVWPGIIVTDDSVTRGISELRKLLADAPGDPRYIETIRKGGYRLIAPVTSVAPVAPQAPVTPNPAPAVEIQAPERDQRPARPTSAPLVAALAAAGLSVACLWILWTARDSGGQPKGATSPFEPRPFTTLIGRETDAAMSPFGTRVAFAWSGVDGRNYDIYVKSLHGDDVLRLTEDPTTHDVHPAWSPDGLRVAFVRSGEDGSSVHVVPAAGGPSESVVTTSTWIQGLDWSPDGRWLAFAGPGEAPGSMQVRRVSLEDRRVVPVSDPPPLHNDHSPVFSPGGSTIACVRSSLPHGRDSIVLLDEQGTELSVFEASGLPVRGLEWVADEEHLVLAADVGTSARLFLMSVADGAMMEIPVREERVTYPSLSSDGSTLIYEDVLPRQRLYRVHLAGRGAPPEIEPIRATTHSDRDADHSPDGTRLAIVSDRSGQSELWLTDVDGARPRRLTDSGPDAVRAPRWSPDGERIAYVRATPHECELWVASAKGGGGGGAGGRRLLAFESGLVLSDWSRDGASVYVGTDLDGSWEALRIEIDGGRSTRVAMEGAIVAKESLDGRWLYFSKALEQGIWRVPTEGGRSELVIPSFDPAYTPTWGLTGDGLFFAECKERQARLSFFDLRTRETSTLLETPWRHASGLSLSPSGEELVIAMTENGGSDLNVIENFALVASGNPVSK